MFALKRVRFQLPEHEIIWKKEVEAHHAVKSNYILPLIESGIWKTRSGLSEGCLVLPYYKNGTVQLK